MSSDSVRGRGASSWFSLSAPRRATTQRTLTVPGHYLTIQDAINAAQKSDVVLVAPGVYRERIDFLGKMITVRSSHGPWFTTIDAENNGTAVKIGFYGVLDGFTVTGGRRRGKLRRRRHQGDERNGAELRGHRQRGARGAAVSWPKSTCRFSTV